MSETPIGVVASGRTVEDVIGMIERAEQMGIHAVWLTGGGARIDSLTVYAVAAARTSVIKLGTSIVPTYPRHPLVMAGQVQVIDQLAPGRFRLGIGPSHRPSMEGMGITFDSPLTNLREYVQVLKPLLQEGRVDFDGKHYQVHESLAAPVNVPVMGSALQRKSFEVCGEVADGAISWICPPEYLRDVGLPAMREGAGAAGRAVPPLMAHAPVCLSEDREQVREAVMAQIPNPRLKFYQRMLVAAGIPGPFDGEWSDAMMDAVVFWGDEARVAGRISELLSFGADEVLVSPILPGDDKPAAMERTMRFLGKIAGESGTRG
jgi:F420-dependent oxidoreductase-like protein